MSALKNAKVGIVGSGLIGRSWAMLFAGAGYNVALFDEKPEQIQAALADIREQLETHEKNGMLRGTLTSGEQCSLITEAKSLADCVADSVHVQECVFENIDLKRKLFLELDKVASDSVVLSSSTSCFPPSKFTEELKHRSQVIVSHPVNPPYYMPMVELVPAPWTSPETVQKTRNIMISIGQKPVTLKKEIPGFVLNRIQYAILNECYRLVQDDIVTVEDVDIVMSEGLGMRYAFMGPMETAYLNADGMNDYCRRYAQGIYNVSQTFGPTPFFGGETAQKIQDELNARIPMETLQQRRKWRDNCLMHLAQIKKKAGQ